MALAFQFHVSDHMIGILFIVPDDQQRTVGMRRLWYFYKRSHICVSDQTVCVYIMKKKREEKNKRIPYMVYITSGLKCSLSTLFSKIIFVQ